MSMLSSVIGGGKNPADAAMPYYEQIPDILKEYLQPYVDTGMQSMGILADQYGNLVSDPNAMYNQIMGGYDTSASYQAQKKEMTGEASNTAAAGGFTGTTTDIYNQESIINDLMSQDMQKYYQNVLGMYDTGLQGEQNLFNTGYNASGELSSGLANNLSTEGSLAFQGQAQKNANQMGLINSLIKAGTSMATGFMKPKIPI